MNAENIPNKRIAKNVMEQELDSKTRAKIILKKTNMNITQDGNTSHNEKRERKKAGRHRVADPLEQVRISVNNSIICQGKVVLNVDSQEYDDYLQEFRRKLTEYAYSDLAPKGSPLRISKN
jgi:hypothetical protein